MKDSHTVITTSDNRPSRVQPDTSTTQARMDSAMIRDCPASCPRRPLHRTFRRTKKPTPHISTKQRRSRRCGEQGYTLRALALSQFYRLRRSFRRHRPGYLTPDRLTPDSPAPRPLRVSLTFDSLPVSVLRERRLKLNSAQERRLHRLGFLFASHRVES